jgi:hypothetical protein
MQSCTQSFLTIDTIVQMGDFASASRLLGWEAGFAGMTRAIIKVLDRMHQLITGLDKLECDR